jgi:hypothetical protein
MVYPTPNYQVSVVSVEITTDFESLELWLSQTKTKTKTDFDSLELWLSQMMTKTKVA